MPQTELQFLTSALASLGIPAVVSAAVAGLIFNGAKETLTSRIRGSIKSEYDHRLETLKAQLKADADIQLEHHKHSLSMQASRDSLRYARLAELRAEAICEVYSALSATSLALRNYTMRFMVEGSPSLIERANLLQEQQGKFFNSFINKRIFFPADLADRLEKLNSEIVEAANLYTDNITLVQPGMPNQTEIRIDVHRRINGPIQESLRELEGEFRKLMGSHES